MSFVEHVQKIIILKLVMAVCLVIQPCLVVLPVDHKVSVILVCQAIMSIIELADNAPLIFLIAVLSISPTVPPVLLLLLAVSAIKAFI